MCEFTGGKKYTFLEMELRFNCPSVLWLLPHGNVPDSLGTVVRKKKNPGRIIATLLTIKKALENLGHFGEIKNPYRGSRRKEEQWVP